MSVLSAAPEAGPSTDRISTIRSLLGWVITRSLLVLLVRASFEGAALADVATYFDWARSAWLHGLLPGRDFVSEYPPGSFPFILLPATGHGPFGYLRYFSGLLLLFDAGLLAQLLSVARRSADATAVRLWVWGPLLMGPLFLERFDLVPAVLAALALAALSTRPALGAALLTAAASVKVWPLVLLPLLTTRLAKWRSWLVVATATALLIVAASWIAGVQEAWRTTFSQQADRGLQVEAVAATPYDWLRVVGVHHARFQHGAWEITLPTGSLVGEVVWWSGLVGIGVLLVVLCRRVLRGRSVDVAVAGSAITACILVVDKALSPQYLVWLLALVAVGATRPFPRRAHVVALLLSSLFLTQLVYPLMYTRFLHGGIVPVLALTGRNLCLILLAGLLVRATLTADGMPVRRPLEKP